MSEFRIFISSTFRDLNHERRLLQDVFSDLRAECRGRGHDLKVVDLRWGISEEEQRQGRTMEVCLEEVAHCQAISPRPNFLILLGDRYGWEPAPDRIEVGEFDQLVAHLEPGARETVEGLYATDENASPAVRLLRRERLDGGSVDEAQLVGFLRTAVRSAGWSADDPRSWKYLHSATHQEILRGALGPEAPAPESHVLVTVRGRQSGPAAPEELAQLEALEVALDRKLGEQCIHRYPSSTSDRAPDDPQSFAEAVRVWYRRVLGEAMDEADRLQGALEGDGEPSRHSAAARRKSQVFVGREGQVEEVLDALSREEVTSIKVTGGGGSGKSAFLAKVLDSLAPGSSAGQGGSPQESPESHDYAEYEPPAEPARNNSSFFGLDRHKNVVPQDVEQIRETVREILRVEAPIHVDVLCHRVSKRWGMKSYTARTRAAMEPFLAEPGLVELDGEFCWSPGGIQEVVAPRSSSPKWREGGHIHEAEVRGGLVALLTAAQAQGSQSIKIKSLNGQIKALFGVSKGARQLAATFASCFEWAEGLGWKATATTLSRSAAEEQRPARKRVASARVVARFVGETDRSTTYADLLNSIILELLPGWTGPLVEGADSGLQEGGAWPEALKAAGAEKPVVILLDGVDQLRGAPAAAHALVPQVMPKGVKLVVSTVVEAPNWLPRDQEWSFVLTLPGFSPEHSKGALDGWLDAAGRCLTPEQSGLVMDRAMGVDEGQALFIRLAAGASSRWESAASVIPGDAAEGAPVADLSRWGDVRGLITSELERLDRLHTGRLASKLLSLVAASKHGLNEKEIQGGLQQLPGFWEAFVEAQHGDHREALLAAGSIPDSVLLRLLGDLRDVFLKEWNGYYQPAHRLISVHAGGDEEERRAAASAIADHFLGSDEQWFLDQGTGRSAPNRRKVQELPHALADAGREDELLGGCLTSEACLAATAVAKELEGLLSMPIPSGHELSESATTYRQKLRGAPALLFQRPTAELVESVLEVGGGGTSAVLPKLTGLAGFRLLDLDAPSMRALFGDGKQVQERDLTTGKVVNSEPGIGGLLLDEGGPRWLLLREDGSVSTTALDRGADTEQLLPPQAGYGADPAPVAGLGSGRTLRVYPDSATRSRSRVVKLDHPGGQIALEPGHTNTISGLAWSTGCAALGTGSLLVASAGSDRFLRLYQVDEVQGTCELLHERKFAGRLSGVCFTGPEDEHLVVIELAVDPEHALWHLDLRQPRAGWEESWTSIRRGVRAWPDPARAGAARAGSSLLWVGTEAGVVELDLATDGVERVVVPAEAATDLSIDVVAPGVGYAVYRSKQESDLPGRSTTLEHHLVFRADRAPVELAVQDAHASGGMRRPRVQRAANGDLLCLELSESECLVARDPLSLEPRETVPLPGPVDLGFSPYELGAGRWDSLDRLNGGLVRVSNLLREDGLFLDLDEQCRIVGQGTWLGAERHEEIPVDSFDGEPPSSAPLAVRSDEGEQVIQAGAGIHLRRPDGDLSRIAGARSHVGRDVHQRFVADGSLVSVDRGGIEWSRRDGASERTELLPLRIARLMASGASPALIAGDGAFWFQRPGQRVLTRWAESGFACLDAEEVSGGTWVVATMSSLHRITPDGAVERLAGDEGTMVRLLGCDGESVLCEVGPRLLLASAAGVMELERGSLPAGRPRLHRFAPGVLLFEDEAGGALVGWTVERGASAGVDTTRWLELQDTFSIEEAASEEESFGGRSARYRCTPGGLLYRDEAGWRFTDLPLGGTEDRPLDGGRFQRSREDWSLEIPGDLPEEARSVTVVRGAVAWLREGELYTAEVVAGTIAEPMLRAEGLEAATLKGSWAHGRVHVFEERRGLCWSLDCKGDGQTPGVPYRGKLLAALEDGGLVVRHPSGLVLSAEGSWEDRAEPIEERIGFTVCGRDVVVRGPEESVVRSVAGDEILASFPGVADSRPSVARELMVHEESPGVFTCEPPRGDDRPEVESAAAKGSAGEERFQGKYSRILGVDEDAGALLCAKGAPRALPDVEGAWDEEAEDGWSDEIVAVLLRPGSKPVKVPGTGTVMTRAGGLPVFHERRTLELVEADGGLRSLEVPADWWSSSPENMDIPGPGVRLRLPGRDGEVAYDWLPEGAVSGLLVPPADWESVTEVLGTGAPIVVTRWVDAEDWALRRQVALFDPERGTLGEPLTGTWSFHRVAGDCLLAVEHAGLDSAAPLRLFRSDAEEPTRLIPFVELDRRKGAETTLAVDPHRECLWVLTTDRLLRRVGADGAVTSVEVPELADLGTPKWGRAPEYVIDVLPGEVVLRRKDEGAAGLVVAVDPERDRAQVVDLLPGCTDERLVSLQATASGHHALGVEDLTPDLKKQERFILRVGQRQPGGEMELAGSTRPWSTRSTRSDEHGLIPMEGGLGSVTSGPSGLVYLLLSWSDLEILREEPLAAGPCSLRSAHRGDGGLHLMGNTWAAFVPDAGDEPARVQVWSPVVNSDTFGEQSPTSCGTSNGSLSLRFAGGAAAEWDAGGRLERVVNPAPPLPTRPGMPTCALLRAGEPLLVGGEGGQVTVLHDARGPLTSRTEAGDDRTKKTWQVVALFPVDEGTVLVVHRCGVVDLLDLASGSCRFSWEPRSKAGDVRPQAGFAYLEADGLLLQRLGDGSVKVMDVNHGRVRKSRLEQSCLGLEPFGPGRVAALTAGNRVDVLLVSGDSEMRPEHSLEGSRLVHAAPGKSWIPAIQTPEGMLLPGREEPLPVRPDRRAEVAVSADGGVWACLQRKKVTVLDREGTQLLQVSLGKVSVSSKLEVRAGSKLERPPVGISPEGGTVGVFLEAEGGSQLRLLRVSDGREETLRGVKDCWFTDEQTVVLVTEGGAIEQRALWAEEDSTLSLVPPTGDLIAVFDLPGERTLRIHSDRARVFRGASEIPIEPIQLEPLQPGSLSRVGLSPCGGYLAEGRQQGVISIYRLEDGAELSPPLLFSGNPEWLAVAVVRGRAWGLTTAGQVLTRTWAPW